VLDESDFTTPINQAIYDSSNYAAGGQILIDNISAGLTLDTENANANFIAVLCVMSFLLACYLVSWISSLCVLCYQSRRAKFFSNTTWITGIISLLISWALVTSFAFIFILLYDLC